MDFTQLPDEREYRFIAVLNKKVETGRLFNALGHMTAGLAGKSGKSDLMCFLEYKDNSNTIHPHISHFPFIVLAADNSNQIRTLRNQAIENNLIFTDFTSTMTVGSSQEQFETTANTSEIDLEYYGICLFGKTNELRDITKKFSLFK